MSECQSFAEPIEIITGKTGLVYLSLLRGEEGSVARVLIGET